MQPTFICKYQPKTLDDFSPDNKIAPLLKHYIEISDVVPMHILLNGCAASGKTTLLNAVISDYFKGIPSYEKNTLYINSLQEQGINYYRTDVNTFCQTCSNIKNKLKIVVIDNIDFINSQSQQVFRKYIDKYGHSVIFIASCNNIQNVIESLQSRLLVINIQPISNVTMINAMNIILSNENIIMDDLAKEYVINISNRNIKTMINYINKFWLIQPEIITLEIAMKLCTSVCISVLNKYTQLLIDDKLNEAVATIYEIYDQGYSVIDILNSYFSFISGPLSISMGNICNISPYKYDIVQYICKYITVFYDIHEYEIELALFTNNIHSIIHKNIKII